MKFEVWLLTLFDFSKVLVELSDALISTRYLIFGGSNFPQLAASRMQTKHGLSPSGVSQIV